MGYIYENVDEDTAEELALYIINDRRLYDQRRRPLTINYAKKMAKGIFEEKAALKGVVTALVTPGIRQYKQELGAYSLSHTGRVSQRIKDLAAKEILDQMMDEIRTFAKQMKKEAAKKKSSTSKPVKVYPITQEEAINKDKWFLTHSIDNAVKYAGRRRIYRLPNGVYAVRKKK